MFKKKIAFCLRDMKIGGVESVLIRTLTALLARADLDITLITYANISEPLYVEWLRAHPQIQVRTLYPCKWLGTDLVHFFPIKILQHWARDIYRWFMRIFMNSRKFADIDVFVDYYNLSFWPEFKKISKTKIAWWHSSGDVFVRGRYIKKMSRYDRFVVLTDVFLNGFKKLYPNYADMAVRIYNPIDVNLITERAKNAPQPEHKQYFVSVSRLYADKDIMTLLRGFDLFWTQNNQPDVFLDIVGDGSWALRYKTFAASLPSANNIIFVGALSNPMGYIANAMGNILSSYNEGFGMVLIEAAALNTLNISSDCSDGPREILLDRRGGELFAPGDAEQLADCMSAIWNNRVDVEKKINFARESLQRFDIDKIIPQIVSLFQNEI